MTKKQHYMTYPERVKLETLLRFKVSVAQIARELGCCRQTVYNEIRRGQYVHTGRWKDEIRYSADKGQSLQEKARKNKGRPLKLRQNPEYWRYLEERLIGMQPNGKIVKRKRYSPAAALELARREHFGVSICVNTLYNYIYRKQMGRAKACDLWEAPYRRRGQERRSRIAHPQYPSIEVRPEHINQRSELGHKEIDLVVSGKKGKSALLTITDRKSREEIIVKLPNKEAVSVVKALSRLRKAGIKSISTDNGGEFLSYDEMKKYVPEIYYCHSYAAWEKGTNENHNRMIRRWYPKGTNFDKITEKELKELADWMNHYPRKSLDWRTPTEAAEE